MVIRSQFKKLGGDMCNTCSARISRNCIGVEEIFLLAHFVESSVLLNFCVQCRLLNIYVFLWHRGQVLVPCYVWRSHGWFLWKPWMFALCYCSLGLFNLPGCGQAYCKYTSLVSFIEICHICAVIFKRSTIPEIDGSPHHTLESQSNVTSAERFMMQWTSAQKNYFEIIMHKLHFL